MSSKTKIQWCDSTANPTMGCDGCPLWVPEKGIKICYAGSDHERKDGKVKGFSPRFEILTFWPGRMTKAAGWRDLRGSARPDKPWLDGMPRMIFVSDMSDALSAAVSFEYLEAEIIDNVTSPKGRRHAWLWLSKRPARMAKFSGWLGEHGRAWPDNLWAGTSIINKPMLAGIDHLARVGGDTTTRFLSVEPQWEDLDIDVSPVDWVIHGGESPKNPRPFRIEWAEDLRARCRESGKPYFLKQLGGSVVHGDRTLELRDRHGGDWSEWQVNLA